MAQLTTLINASPSALPDQMLVEVLTDYEAEAALLSDTSEQDLVTGFYASYLIALLLVSNLEEARYLTHRWPSKYQDKNPLLVNSRSLLKAIWSNKYPLVHRILQESPWPDLVKPLIARFQDQFRQSTLAELSLAYSSVRHNKVSTLLGLQPDKGNERPNAEILEKLTESGWKWDDENGLWRPGPLPTKDESGGLIGGSTVGDDGMSGLVGLVGFLGE